MREWTETRREGTDVGPVDWSHEWVREHRGWRNHVPLESLRDIEAHPENWQATTDGGWPRVGWRKVLAFRMYDGWPYWTPHPALLAEGPLGVEWMSLRSISDVEPRRAEGRTTKEEKP